MYASVVRYFLKESLRIGGIELGHGSPFQYQRDYRVIFFEIFQNFGICRITGLGLFSVGQSHFLEQDIAELLRGADIEGLSRTDVYFLSKLVCLLRQCLSEIDESLSVNGDTLLLHGNEDISERYLDLTKQSVHFLSIQSCAQRGAEPVYGQRIRFTHGNAVLTAKALHVVLRRTYIQQIRGEGAVKHDVVYRTVKRGEHCFQVESALRGTVRKLRPVGFGLNTVHTSEQSAVLCEQIIRNAPVKRGYIGSLG